MRLPDGRYRMYVSTAFSASEAGIGSAISDDGLTFIMEPGLRVSVADAAAGEPALSPGDLVDLGDGRHRMYFSSFNFTQQLPTSRHVVKSAVSSDLVTWTVEAGDRIGGSAKIDGSGEHPAAVHLATGGYLLFYGRPTPGDYGLHHSWSPDGLTFTREEMLLPQVLDSAFLPLSGGRLSGWIGRRDNAAGRSYVSRVRLTPQSR